MLTKKQQELLLFIHQKLQEEGIPPSFDEMKDALELKSKSGIHRLITALEERGFIRRLPNRARALEIIRLPDGHRERQLADMNADPNTQLSGFNEPTTRPGSNIHTTANTQPPVNSQAENMPALARRGFRPSVIDGGLASASELSKSANNVLSGEFGEARSPDYDGANAQSTGQAPVQAPVQVPVQVPVMGRIAAGVPISAVENYSQTKLVPPDMVGPGEYFALEVEGESMIEAGIHDGDTIICHKTDTATAGDIVVAFIDDEEATLKRFRRQGNSIALEAANAAFETRVYDQQRIKVQGRLVGLMRNYQ